MRKTQPQPDLTAGRLTELRPLRWWAQNWPGLSAGRRISVATLYRFALHGSAGVQLATRKVPGVGICCTAADVAEFLDAIEAVRRGMPDAPRRRVAAARRRRTDAILARYRGSNTQRSNG